MTECGCKGTGWCGVLIGVGGLVYIQDIAKETSSRTWLQKLQYMHTNK